QDIGAQARRGFGAIVGDATLGNQQRGFAFGFPVPFADAVGVEQFAQCIAIPPDAEVAGARLALGDGFALDVPDARQAGTGGPHFVAGVARVDVHGHAPADIRAWLAPEDLAGFGVTEIHAVLVFGLL